MFAFRSCVTQKTSETTENLEFFPHLLRVQNEQSLEEKAFIIRDTEKEVFYVILEMKYI